MPENVGEKRKSLRQSNVNDMHARGQVPGRTLFADEDVWLTQAQLAEIYQTTQQNVSLHLQGIYEDKELDDESTHKKFLLVRQEGKRQVKRETEHYNLDVIIAL